MKFFYMNVNDIPGNWGYVLISGQFPCPGQVVKNKNVSNLFYNPFNILVHFDLTESFWIVRVKIK